MRLSTGTSKEAEERKESLRIACHQKLSQTIKPFAGSSHKKPNNSARPTKLSRPSPNDERINALEQQLRATQNPKVPSTANQEASAKVDRNDLAEIHRRYTAVLSTLQEKKCTLTNAYRLAGTARSTISDFLGVAELKIVNEVTFESTLERLGNPKLAVKTIEQECRKQLGGLLPVVKRLRLMRKLLPLAQDNAFHS